MISWLIIACFSSIGDAFHTGNRQTDIQGEGGLYLAINALAFIGDDGNMIKRRLEVNFFGFEVFIAHSFILNEKTFQVYDDDTVTINFKDSEPISFLPWNFPDGYYISSKQIPYPSSEGMDFVRTCVFGVNATWTRGDGAIVAENCLQSEPSWMWDHR